jgi:hypothetical protein
VVRIDVEPAETAATGTAAGELARILRQASGRLDAVGPLAGASATLAAWATTWLALRAAVLSLATTGEDLSTTSGVAASRYRQTDSGVMVPDAR